MMDDGSWEMIVGPRSGDNPMLINTYGYHDPGCRNQIFPRDPVRRRLVVALVIIIRSPTFRTKRFKTMDKQNKLARVPYLSPDFRIIPYHKLLKLTKACGGVV